MLGDAAPVSVDVFCKLCTNDLMIGEGQAVGPFGYLDSAVERVDTDRAIVFGRIKSPAGVGREAKQV